MGNQKIVLFDFDKTITKIDTILLFYHYFLNQRNKGYRYSIVVLLFGLFKLNIISEHSLKQFLCSSLVKGLSESEVELIARNFYKEYSAKIFNSQLIEELKLRRLKGEKVYIVSSNFDFLLKPLFNILPIEDIFATTTEKSNHIFTGKLIGNVCSGKEKLKRVSELINGIDKNFSTGFGDSPNDYEFLFACNTSFLVKYKKGNKKIATLIKLLFGKFDFSNPNTEIISFKKKKSN